jgi:hypothetical protein
MKALTTEERADIEALMDGAANHGDREQIAICERALDGDTAAIDECMRVLSRDDQEV